MENRLIVLTGISKSGKSEVARSLSSHLTGYTCHNIGDALAKCIGIMTSDQEQRKTIGPRFLSQYGESGYIEVLQKLAKPRRILDGVRLLVGMQALRELFPDLLHIHKIGDRHSSQPGNYDAEELQNLSDITLPWTTDPVNIDEVVQLKVLPLLATKP